MMATRFCADGVTGQGFRFALLGGVVLLSACAPMALTAVGVGSAAGVQHTMGGITYRTFTVPLPQVRGAAVAGLNRMGIKVDSRDKSESGEVIKATANGRSIEIELDALTPNTTRMRTSVRNGLFMDAATGAEIIMQTERVLNNGKGALT
jgi:hypothetical protein